MSKSRCIYDNYDNLSYITVQDEYVDRGTILSKGLILCILPPNYTINAVVSNPDGNQIYGSIFPCIKNIPSDINTARKNIDTFYSVLDDNYDTIYSKNYGSDVSLLSTDYELYNDDKLTITDYGTYVQFVGPTVYMNNNMEYNIPYSTNIRLNIKNIYNEFDAEARINTNVLMYNNILTFVDNEEPQLLRNCMVEENNALNIKYTNNTSNAHTLLLWNENYVYNSTLIVEKTIAQNKDFTEFYYYNNTITIPSSNYTRIELIPYVDAPNYTCSLKTGTLPEGLYLNEFTGEIRNTENVTSIQSGVYNITVVCDNGNISMSYSLTINVIDNYLGYEPEYKFTTNNNITITPVNTFTGVRSSDNLPTGLSIDRVTGVITGRITTSFNDNIKVNYSEIYLNNNAENFIQCYNTFNLIVSNVIIKNIIILC